MIRNALLAAAAVIVVGASFLATFAAWNHMDRSRALALGVPYTEFNWQTANAQSRGCNACHGGHLDKDVSRLVVARKPVKQHGIFVRGYDVPMRVEDCLICHGKSFAGSMHSRHLHAAAFNSMGGTCDSCHGTKLDGKFVLYTDETRYDILNGVSYSKTPEFIHPSATDGAAATTGGAN
jgi:hypothetical protein